jgi:hypothetical protein
MGYYQSQRDHGLVVEHVLAKDEMGVRFSLVAPGSRSLMDKVLVFGTSDVGSIPAGSTNTYKCEAFYDLC